MRWILLSRQEEKNQAEKLQQLFTEITSHEKEIEQERKVVSKKQLDEKTTYEEIDVLNLPPRSEVHKKIKWRFSVRFSAPIVRFIFFFLILIIVIFVILFFYYDGLPFKTFIP